VFLLTQLNKFNLNVHPGRCLYHPSTACHILTSCIWSWGDWLSYSWGWTGRLSSSWVWTDWLSGWWYWTCTVPRVRLARYVNREINSRRATAHLIALKVKLDLLGVSLRDLPYLGSIVVHLFSTWRGDYVRLRESSSFIQHYSWLPFQCLWILNGHLLSWNQAG